MESLYTLSGPPSWVTASTNLSWSSAVHRRRGFGSVVRTKLASPGKLVPSSGPPWNSPCPPLPSSGSECIAEYIFPRQKMNPPTEKKGNEKMQQKIRFWFQGRGAEPQVRTEKERRERERGGVKTAMGSSAWCVVFQSLAFFFFYCDRMSIWIGCVYFVVCTVGKGERTLWPPHAYGYERLVGREGRVQRSHLWLYLNILK